MAKVISLKKPKDVPELGTVDYPLDQLELHRFNPRQNTSAEEIALLAESIKACGLIQSLAGIVRKSGKVGIVAGGRRLRALQLLAKNGGWDEAVPVRLATDKMQAQTWANAENTARSDLDPADEIRAYGAMAKSGSNTAAISAAFAVTEGHVKRRLKLASLPEAVLDALKAKVIGLSSAEAFTICNDENRMQEALAGVEAGEVANLNALRRFLQPVSVSATDRRAVFVSIEAYEQAGGSITRDLFSEDVFLENPDLLVDLFAQKLEVEVDTLKADGWHWVDVLEGTQLPWDYLEANKLSRIYPVQGELSEAEAEEYEALAERYDLDGFSDEENARLEALQIILNGDYTTKQKVFAGVVVHVDFHGTLCIAQGFVDQKDRSSAIERGILVKPIAPPAGLKSGGYSKALQLDLHRTRLAAAQTALLDKPSLVLDLLAFTLSTASGDFVDVLDLDIGKPANKPKKLVGLDFDTRLEHRPDTWSEDVVRVDDTAKAFAVFQCESKKVRNVVITEGLARTLSFSDGVFLKMLNKQTGADLRSIWTPNALNFFKRVNGDILTSIYADIMGMKPSHQQVKTFAGMKKSEKIASLDKIFNDADRQKHLSAEQVARVAKWEPSE